MDGLHARGGGGVQSNPGVLKDQAFGRRRTQALKQGMITLRQDGWRKVLEGKTTLDEVARVTAGDLS